MRVMLGYLLKEAAYCPFTYDETLNERWISGIREYIPSEPFRSDVLYVASMYVSLADSDAPAGTIPILMPDMPDRSLPAAFSPIVPKGGAKYRQIVQAMHDEFDKMEDLYLCLYKATCCGSGLNEIINMIGTHTPNHVYVADMSFKVLAYTDRPYMNEMSATWRYQVLHGYLPVHVMKGLIENGEFEILNGYHNAAVHYSKSFYVPFITRNVFYKNHPQAHVFVCNIITRPNYKDIVLGQLLGDFLEQNIHILSQYRPERINSNYEDFFRDVLVGGCTDEKLIAEQIELIGWNDRDRFGLAVCDMENRDESLRRTIMYEIESRTNWMCFNNENDLLIVADLKHTNKGRNKLILKELAERYGLQIYVAVPFLDIRTLGQQYDLLKTIRNLHRKVNAGIGNCLVDASDLAPYFYIEKLRCDNTSISLCSPDAKKILDHDKEHGTELLDTYLSFLLNDRNLVRSAKELNIHRNTLVYRIEKIREMISSDDDDPIQKLHLLLSMMILKNEKDSQST